MAPSVIGGTMVSCSLNFNRLKNGIAWDIYEKLVSDGVSCQQMDEGYRFIDDAGKKCRSASTNRSCVVGAHDGVLEAPEVIEYALSQYGKYRRLIEGTLGEPLPWVLDDLDPTTSFDDDIRKKIVGTIGVIKENLSAKGIREGTDAYREALATALFYFAIVPPIADMTPRASEYYASTTRELEALGLGLCRAELLKNGGVGFIKGTDYREEFSALTALSNNRGECSEQSKVLFALFEMAGLRPQYIAVDHETLQRAAATDPRWKEALRGMPDNMGHVLIGVAFGGRYRLYDVAMLNSDAHFARYQPLSLRQFLSIDYSTRADMLAAKGRFDEALPLLAKAFGIDARNADGYYHQGMLYHRMGDFDRAAGAYTAALGINPRDAWSLNNRGAAYLQKKEYRRALKDFEAAIAMSPRTMAFYKNAVQASFMSGDYKTAASFVRRARVANSAQLAELPFETRISFGFAFALADDLPAFRDEITAALAAEPQLLRMDSDFTNRLPLVCSKRWRRTPTRIEQSRLIEEETGVEIGRLEGQFIVWYSAWNVGRRFRPPIIAGIKSLIDQLNERLSGGARFSPSTKSYLREMLDLMPGEMARTPEIADGLAILKRRLR